MKIFILPFLVFVLFGGLFLPTQASNTHRYKFVLKETSYTRLCETKKILTVNGQFPGPTIKVRQGDTAYVHVHNEANESVTIHWHGVKQPRYPWSDGPEFVTQCPIKPGGKFIQKIVFSDEIGTLWWHAHSDWSRATVHGFIFIYPKIGDKYPFKKPDAEFSLLLGEWWKSDIMEVLSEFIRRGGDPNISDAFLINGQPGYLYNCSAADTFKQVVHYGKTYLVRMVNAAMNNILFFGIRNHNVTVVGTDAAYTKPLNTDYIAISPGQTIDFLLNANQKPGQYSIAARAYNRPGAGTFDNTTTTAILEYRGKYPPRPVFPVLPVLPDVESINASVAFTKSLRSLASAEHPIDVPKGRMTNLFFTVSINTLPCADCDEGPRPGTRLSASVNNISLLNPRIDVLQAYYNGTRGVYDIGFPDKPPYEFDYTAANLSRDLQTPSTATKVRVLEYNTQVEIVFQSTNLVAGIDHPMHLHGYSFYVVGSGLGNYNSSQADYNLVDPPLQNTIAVPVNGWSAIRFKADNPGVWFMHCHFERHVSWGMGMVFIVKDGKGNGQNMLPPPGDLPPC